MKIFVLCNLPTESELLFHTPITNDPVTMYVVRLEITDKDNRYAVFSSEDMAKRFCTHLQSQDAYRDYNAQILSLEMNKPELTLSSSAKASIAISAIR